jgi:hypothetical protein
MSLSEFAAVSTAVSGIAVTVSLIYLAIQTRQNTRNTRAQIQQGGASRTASILLAMMDVENIKTWIEANGNEVTPKEIRDRRFHLQCDLAINAIEDHFHQYEAGLQSDELFRRNVESLRVVFSEPGVRAYWKSLRSGYGRVAPRFCAFVDDLYMKQAPGSTNAGS